jgi:hypothetical protein
MEKLMMRRTKDGRKCDDKEDRRLQGMWKVDG